MTSGGHLAKTSHHPKSCAPPAGSGLTNSRRATREELHDSAALAELRKLTGRSVVTPVTATRHVARSHAAVLAQLLNGRHNWPVRRRSCDVTGTARAGIGAGADPAVVDAVAVAADDCGFATLWVGEHVVMVDRPASRYPYSRDGVIAVPAQATINPIALSFAGQRSRVDVADGRATAA